ncbi:unnamed protein product [Adineta steineri]|uniref:SGNH hydrolase-type esterase domain-containing protein n=1 Tax=Adineta steineri TaxID=433720 RepID=A0A819X9U9_9BILA|nr:unnamed protein product [Adineta steineri]
MMHKMQIDHESSASSQVILPLIFENSSITRSSHHHHHHQQQKTQRDRSRFFFKLRQNKKQNRLQQGPLPIHTNHQHHVHNIEKHIHEKNREIKLITAIVGSSIARNVSIKNIENEQNEVRLQFKSGSDCADALACLQSPDGQTLIRGAHQLIFIIGTNDLHRVGAYQTVQRIDHTVSTVRNLYPGINVVWQLLQQRTRKTCLLPEGPAVLHEIEKCNILLLELARNKNFDTIQPAIPIRYMYDGLHPSKYGVEMMEHAIRTHLHQKHIIFSSSFSTTHHQFHNFTSPPPLMSIAL